MSSDTDQVDYSATDNEDMRRIESKIEGISAGDRMNVDDMRRIEEKLDRVLAISAKVETLVTTVADQVKPVLDDLMKSPLLKMLGVKGK